MRRKPFVLVLLACLISVSRVRLQAKGDGLLRLPSAILLLGWGDVNSLIVTTPTETVHVLPAPGQPETRSYGSPSIPSISRDGKLVACIRLRSNQPQRASLAIYSLADGRWTEFGEAEHIGAVSISPDGSRLAYVADEGHFTPCRLRILDLMTRRMSSPPGPDCPGALTWAPGGKRLAYEFNRASGSGDFVPGINTLELMSGKTTKIADGRDPSWAPSGEWIAYLDQLGERCMLIHSDGSGARVLFGLAHNFFSPFQALINPPVWSPDSRTLALNVTYGEGNRPNVVLLDVGTGRRTKKLEVRVPLLGWAEAAQSAP